MPIYLAAIGPKNTTLGAEIADGWIPTLFSPEHVGEFRPLLEEGFARAGGGKGFDDFDIAPTVNVNVTDDLDAARDAMRPYVALYVGGMGSRKQNFYNALVQRYGFEDAAREVQDLYLDGKSEEAMAALPGELLDKVSLTRAARRGARAPRDLPRRGRRDADGLPDGVVARRPARAAAARRRAGRLSVRIYLGAFGDPGHAFPMIALGGALVRARPHGRDGHLAEVARAGRGGRHDVHAGARVPGLPDAARSRSSPTRRRCGRRGRSSRSCTTSRPTSRSPTSSPPAPRWPPSSRACRWPRSSPTSTRSSRRRPPDLLDRRAAAAHAGRARRCGAGRTGASSRARWSRGARSTTRRAAGSGSTRCRGSTPRCRAS